MKDDKGKVIMEKGPLLWKEPGMGDAGKAAFLEAIKDGKGFMAFHSGSDTFHSKGHKGGEMIRNVDEKGNDAFDPYIQMLGGEFIIHGAQQMATLKCVDPNFPGAKAYDGEKFQEEWYSLKNFCQRSARDPDAGLRRDEGPDVPAASPTRKPGPGCTARGASSTPRWATAKTSGRGRNSRGWWWGR